MGETKERSQIFKKQLLKTWRLSYLAVLTAPLLLFFLFSLTTFSLMKRQITNGNSMVVRFMHQEFDAVFSQVNSICQDVLVGKTFQTLDRISDPREMDSLSLYDTSLALSHLNKNPAVTDFVLLSPSLDFFISPSRWGSLEDFSMIDEFNLGWDGDRMARFFGAERQVMALEDVSTVLPGGESLNRLLVIRPLSYVQNGWSHDFLMAFLVDASPIFSGYLNDFQDMVLLNRLTGTVYYNYSGSFDAGEEGDFLRSLPPGESRFHRGLMVTAVPSDHTNMLYAVMMGFGSYFHALILLLILSILFVSLAMGWSWTIVSRRLQKDWNQYDQAMRKVGSSVEKMTSFDGLYSPFVSSVSQLKKEKEGMGDIIRDQTRSLRCHLIEKLLECNHGPIGERALEECGIHLISDSFAVLLISGGAGKYGDREEMFIHWFLGQGFEVLPFSSPHGVALILNTPETRGDRDFLSLYTSRINEFSRAFSGLFGCIASSDLVTGLDSLGEAYLQAVNVMEYRKTTKSDEFMMYRDVVEMSSQVNYSYTTEQELLLSHAILTGDSAEAERLFTNLIEENRSLGVSPQRLRYLLFNFVDTMIRCTNQWDRRRNGCLPSITLPPILQADDFEASCAEVVRIIGNLCAAVQDTEIHLEIQGGAHFDIYKKILDAVDRNYSDPMLNVTCLSDNLGVSVVLMSRIFKKYHNMNILEYLNSLRIEASKKLLEEGYLVSDVVGVCGFGSLRTFMRVFKKSENMTPGKYRELQWEESGCKSTG